MLAVVLGFWGSMGTSPSITQSGEPCAGPPLSTRVQNHRSASHIDSSEWTATADIYKDESTWTLRLRIEHPQGEARERRFTAASCEAVLEAAAFVVAVAIDSDAGSDESVAAPADEVDVTPAPLVPPAEPSATAALSPASPNAGDGVVGPGGESPRRTAARSQPVRSPPQAPRSMPLALAVSGGVSGGAMPAVAPVLSGVVGLLGTHWRAELVTTFRTPASASSSSQPDAGGRLMQWAAGARGCGVPSVHRVEFPLCLGAEAGQVVGRGFGFAGATSSRVVWAAAVASPGVAYALRRRLALTLRVEAGVPLHRPQFLIGGLGSIHGIGPAFGRALIGVELRLW